MKRIISVLLCMAFVLGFAGCKKIENKLFPKSISCGPGDETDGTQTAKEPPMGSGKTQDLMKNIEKTEAVTKQPDAVFTEAAADFALNLFKNELKSDSNTLVAPLSVLAALAMTQNGAAGETLSQMEKTLGGLSRDDLNAYLGAYLEAVAGGDSELRAANSIWFGEGRIEPEKDFLQKNADFFDAGIYSADFSSSKTVRDINSWVKKNTDGMIDKVIDDIDESSVMYLINALSFEGEWSEPYTDNCVREGSFQTHSGKTEQVSYMYSDEYGYIKMDNAKGFIKPYEGGRFSFAAILPDEGVDIADFVKALDGKTFLTAINSAEECRVLTQMPKFKTEFSAELNKTLISMGMKNAFSESKADFSLMGKTPSGDNLFVSRVIHKTYIEVAEKGTRAGAVTVVVKDAGATMTVAPPPEVRLTRPFVYAIIDNETGVPVFIGAQLKI